MLQYRLEAMTSLQLVSTPTSTLKTCNSENITGGGVDYDSGPYTVTFPAGVTSVPFDVTINDDNTLEDDKDFTLTMMHGTFPNGITRGSIGQATVTIADDDGE